MSYSTKFNCFGPNVLRLQFQFWPESSAISNPPMFPEYTLDIADEEDDNR